MSSREHALTGEEVTLWAASGAMHLTGTPAGPPLAPVGRPAARLQTALRSLSDAARERHGPTSGLPGVTLLGERAAMTRLRRNGPDSCGGGFRLLPTRDGHLGLSLPRPDDLAMVPALVETAVDDPWGAAGDWASRVTTTDAVRRCRLLGLAASAVPARNNRQRRLATRQAVEVSIAGARRHVRERPRIVDLTALWAGPLCAHLLGMTGAEVIKVESVARPDGARRGARAFYDLLHHGHSSVAVDFADPRSLDRVRELICSADLVLESSRPRALEQHGLIASEVVAAGVHWLSITARGRGSDTIGFGDDVAADAGLLAWDGDQPLPAGDAIADPLAGVAAAAAAAEALNSADAHLIDVSMHAVAAEAAQGEPEDHVVYRAGDRWVVETALGVHPIAEPVARRTGGRASALGEHTRTLLR